jgi:hypothetical protein
MEVNNHDVAGIVRRVDRFVEELHKSQSSSVSQLKAADRVRLESYLLACESYQAWVVGEPELDLPESAPKAYSVPDAPVLAEVENESVNDLIRLMSLCREEILNSQSARQSAGLSKFDADRASALLAKCKSLLAHVDSATPLDLPESSPMRAQSGPGARGV